MIDLHCHILPGMDDGAGAMDESVAMCRQAAQDGIHTIVATPHTLDGVYLNPMFKVMEQVSVLNKVLSEQEIPVRILPGSDIHLCRDLWRYVESGEAGTINNDKKYLLLELPVHSVPPGIKDEIFNLKVRGMTPIITHPERNLVIQNDTSVLCEAISLGVLSQMTASSITGGFGGAVKRCAERLLKWRMVHIIASDAHSFHKRPPVLSQSVEAASQVLGNAHEAEQMVVDAPGRVVSGQALEVPEPLKGNRFKFGF